MTIPAGETVDVTVVTPPKTEVTVENRVVEVTVEDRPAPVITALVAGSVIVQPPPISPGSAGGGTVTGPRASRWFWGNAPQFDQQDPSPVPGDDFLDLTTFDLYGYTAPVNLTPGGP